jgi:hypothetical protein
MHSIRLSKCGTAAHQRRPSTGSPRRVCAAERQFAHLGPRCGPRRGPEGRGGRPPTACGLRHLLDIHRLQHTAFLLPHEIICIDAPESIMYNKYTCTCTCRAMDNVRWVDAASCPVGRRLTGFVDLSQRPHEHAADYAGARGDRGACVRHAVKPAARLAQPTALHDPASLASRHDAAGGDAGAEPPRVPARGHDGAGGGAL